MPASGETTPTGDQMQPGEVLRPGDSIRSVNGRFRFGMKADGTLALTNDFGRELWKAPHSGALCVMQGDGNLVIYSASSQAQWASNTSHDAGSHLVVQDDGNVVIYRPDGSSPWATRTVQPELPNGPSPTGSRLQSGEALHWGESIISPSGRYNVSFQSDGNLVIYKAGGTALWSSQTFHNPAAICLMEPGGNFVLYNDLAQVVLSLGTNGNPGAYLEIQDDGNFVLYRPDRQPVWSSKTVQPDGPRATGDQMLAGEALHPTESLVSANGKYTFALQEDGNLVLYANGAALWSSRTSQKPSAVCVMQHDGNLVLYDDHGSKLWASETSHDSESHLVVQDDGNVVVYRPDLQPVWDRLSATRVPTSRPAPAPGLHRGSR